jgi:hypothetical protein
VATELTRELVYAVAEDAANRQMRARGRKSWNTEDFDLACDTFNKLMQHLEELAQ